MLAIPIISDIWSGVTGFFSDVAGKALDKVISVITSWIIGGVLALIEAIWSVIDTSTQPVLDSEWFSGDSTSPFEMALAIGASMLFLTVVAAIIRGVLAGSPGAVTRTLGHDLPLAGLAMAGTIGFTQLALDVSDAMSAWVWEMTRDDAKRALENLSRVLMRGMPGSHFLGVALALVMLVSMLFLWAVLFIRESLIYLVVVFSAAFAWPAIVFPSLRDTARKSVELLAALIIAKPVIALALSVGISALGGIGATGEPGDGTGENLARELGTLVVGVVTFGLAAFMPYLTWKLMPIAAAAVVAQGIASAPIRGVQTAAQMQYYGAATMTRLANAPAAAATRKASSGWSGFGDGERSNPPAPPRPSRPTASSATTDRLAGAR